VLEDDPYGLVRYAGEAIPSIHSLEGGTRVTFTSSFSKTVAPGLRVGWFVVPETMRADYDDRAVSTYISPPQLPQAVVHELFARGGFEPNLERIRGILGGHRDAMLAALDAELAGRAAWSRPDGGYFVWLELGDDDASALLGRATEAGVTFVRGADFFVDGGGASAARLAFSYESPERIAEGVRLLASLL
jgi:2-aminoadipate transaminase